MTPLLPTTPSGYNGNEQGRHSVLWSLAIELEWAPVSKLSKGGWGTGGGGALSEQLQADVAVFFAAIPSSTTWAPPPIYASILATLAPSGGLNFYTPSRAPLLAMGPGHSGPLFPPLRRPWKQVPTSYWMWQSLRFQLEHTPTDDGYFLIDLTCMFFRHGENTQTPHRKAPCSKQNPHPSCCAAKRPNRAYMTLESNGVPYKYSNTL